MRQAEPGSPCEGVPPSSHPQPTSIALKDTQESWRNMASGQPIPRRGRSGPSEMLVGALTLQLALITGCSCISDQNQSPQAEGTCDR